MAMQINGNTLNSKPTTRRRFNNLVYHLSFTTDGVIEFYGLNMLFTQLIWFGSLICWHINGGFFTT